MQSEDLVNALRGPSNHKLPVFYAKLSPSMKAEVRRQYVKEQEGKCYYCDAPLSGEPPDLIKERAINWSLFPEYFLNHPVHLHHDHGTGLTLGAVHAYCNAVLWQYHGE